MILGDFAILPVFGQEFLGFQRCHATHARRSDGLTIDMIGQVARGKHTRD